jgi:predicted membrane channel-forming protein YqfA (hemolysin III family)
VSPLRVSLALFALVTLAALGLNALPVSDQLWAAWQPDGCRAMNCYCEPFRASLILQPLGAYSNLGFVFVGALILGAAHRTQDGRRAHFSAYGVSAIAIGAGSFFYHASLTRVGEWFDLVGLYALTGLLVLFNLARLRPLSGAAFALALLAITTLGGVQMIVARELQQVVFVILAAGALILETRVQIVKRPRAQKRYLYTALACFGAGAFVWILDGSALPCWPDAPLTWHAVWHLLAAASVGLIYLYYRSEMLD